MSDFRISHGRAVAIGMAADLQYAHLLGVLPEEDRDRILALIEQVGFTLWAKELATLAPGGKLAVLRGLEEFREHLGGELCITLVTALGEAREVHEMDAALVQQSIEWLQVRAEASALT